MYGQGSYAPQFRQGPPAPPPQFSQPNPAPPPPFRQPPPPVYHPVQPPVYHPVQPPVLRSVPMPNSYPHPYPQPMPIHHNAPQQMPRITVLPPPPPLQGQMMYRTPPPPPPGIQHVPTPPPPAPPSFVSITPAPFISFPHPPPSLPPPPPPPPPSSPPPLPPSPPPPPPISVLSIEPEEASTDLEPRGEVGKLEEESPVDEGEESGDLPPPPLKPGEEVVRNIEVLCQFIAKVGSHFEDLARTKEAGNPQFAFLFGGEPGSAAAVGHEYFQWMKRKYHFEGKAHGDLEHKAPSPKQPEREVSLQYDDFEIEGAMLSPAESDMDMEDDVSPCGNKRSDELSKDSTGEPTSISSEIDVGKKPLHAPCGATEQLLPKVPVSSTISCSASLPGDGKESPFIEDVSPPTASPEAADCALEDGAQGFVRTSTGDSSLVNVSPAVTCGRVQEVPRVFVEDRRPFQLIQEYASDDSEENDERQNAEDISPVRVSQEEALDLHQDKGTGHHSDFDGQDSYLDEVVCGPSIDAIKPLASTVGKEDEVFVDSSPMRATSSRPVDVLKDVADINIQLQDEEKQEQGNEIVEGGSTDVDHLVGKFHMEDDGTKGSTKLNVDEFGRLLRKGASDSDSDGVDYNVRRGKRGRSRSRSRSPQESRWRRRSRSPKRSDMRNRSPSWSLRRSRSKSPSSFGQPNVFARRERDQRPECFNFIRGRCFRGALCRYLHRDVGRHRIRQQQYQEYPHDFRDHSLRDNAPVLNNLDPDKIEATEMSVDGCESTVPREEQKSPEMQVHRESEANAKPIDGEVLNEENALVSILEDPQHSIKEDGSISQEVISQEMELDQVDRTVKIPNVHQLEEAESQTLSESSEPPFPDNLAIQPSTAGKSQPLVSDTLVGQVDSAEGSHILHQAPGETIATTTFQNQTPETQPYLETAPRIQTYPSQSPMNQSYSYYAQPLDQPLPPQEFPPPNSTTPNNLQPSQFVAPAPQGHPPHHFPSDNASMPFASHHPRGNLPPPMISHPSQLPPSQMFPPRGPIDHHSQRVPPPNPTWPNLPPPPPSHVNMLPNRPPIPSLESPFPQFQQNAMPLRSDFNPQTAMRPMPPGEFARPQVVDFRPQPSHLMEPSHQHPQHIDRFGRMPFTVGNQHDQPFLREEQFPRPPPLDPQNMADPQRDFHLRHQPFRREEVRAPFPGHAYNSNPFPDGGNMHPQLRSFPREPLPLRPQSFPGDHMPLRFPSSGEFATTIHDLPHQPPYQYQPPVGNFPSSLSTPGMVDTSFSRYPSSYPENNMPRNLPDAGLPKIPISSHYNPYASTFEQMPSSSKYASNVPGRENNANYNNRYYSSPRSGNVLMDGPGPRITASPPSYRRSDEQILPRLGTYPPETLAVVPSDVQKQFETKSADDIAYDPLFDSIEPSSDGFKKFDHVKENQGTSDGGTVSKLSSLQGAGDVETIGIKVSGAAEVKSEADELGEEATDAEVGAVENASPQLVGGNDWSPGIPIDLGNTAAAGEIEIDQARSPGKSKKSKDSRSMKLFRIALADFVKEVLKPSWRQGNMSKEAFKTIVKKTVDKVSGAMLSHQVPKTQVKINQYVESSQRKLTKLVMGYVDKYVKM